MSDEDTLKLAQRIRLKHDLMCPVDNPVGGCQCESCLVIRALIDIHERMGKIADICNPSGPDGPRNETLTEILALTKGKA